MEGWWVSLAGHGGVDQRDGGLTGVVGRAPVVERRARRGHALEQDGQLRPRLSGSPAPASRAVSITRESEEILGQLLTGVRPPGRRALCAEYAAITA